MLMFSAKARAEEKPLAVATFQIDATPPLGTPLCDGGVTPARKIVDPLSARGLVLLNHDLPIVLCAVDWVGIGGLDCGLPVWRNRAKEYASTRGRDQSRRAHRYARRGAYRQHTRTGQTSESSGSRPPTPRSGQASAYSRRQSRIAKCLLDVSSISRSSSVTTIR